MRIVNILFSPTGGTRKAAEKTDGDLGNGNDGSDDV